MLDWQLGFIISLLKLLIVIVSSMVIVTSLTLLSCETFFHFSTFMVFKNLNAALIVFFCLLKSCSLIVFFVSFTLYNLLHPSGFYQLAWSEIIKKRKIGKVSFEICLRMLVFTYHKWDLERHEFTSCVCPIKVKKDMQIKMKMLFSKLCTFAKFLNLLREHSFVTITW